MARTILVTGGLGFIGSHTIVQLLAAGHQVICLDNLSNSKLAVLDQMVKISGSAPAFVEGDIRDEAAIEHPNEEFMHATCSVFLISNLRSAPEIVQ